MQRDPVEVLARRGNPLMRRGAPSLNPAGRSRGFAGVARQIMAETRDGAELVEFALRIFRDEHAPMRDRQEAHAWLSDRGLGRPLANVELTATIEADVTAPRNAINMERVLKSLPDDVLVQVLEAAEQQHALPASDDDVIAVPMSGS